MSFAEPDNTTPLEPGTEPDALQRLLQRLQRQPDFPALQAMVTRVQRVARNERARVQALAEAVMGDPGFTNRLLRLINAAYYRSAGGGSITSVTRAIAVMGFRTVQELAVSSRMIDKLPRDRRGLALREDFLRALLAARLTRELCADPRQLEDAYITGLFQNLGRMLVSSHLPDDALGVRDAVPRASWPLVSREHEASRRLLGLSYAEIGQHVAEMWGWPRTLRQLMRHDAEAPLHASPQREERLRWLGMLGNDLADLLLYAEPTAWEPALEALVRRLGPASGQQLADLQAALARTRPALEELADAVGLPLSQLRDWHRSDAVDGHPTLTGLPRGVQAAAQATALEGAELLADRAQAFSDALLDGRRREVPQQVLAALRQGLRGHRAVLCVGGAARRGFQVMHQLGLDGAKDGAARAWQIDPARGDDLFSLLCQRGTDTLIHDAQDSAIARRLPEWFRQHVNARRFLVLPLTARRKPVGMIYLDRPDDDPFVIDDREMRLVRTLRNQAVMALG